MQYDEIIAALSEKIGIPLTSDDGVCQLGVDDMQVTLMSIPEAESISLYAEIGMPPPQGLETLYRTMLECNHLFKGTMGSTISLDEESGKFYLCRYDRLQMMEIDQYLKILENFVNTLETWQGILRDYRPQEQPAEKPAGEGEGAAPEFPLGGNGFMAV